MARKKKPPVSEEKAQEWFERRRRGETPPQIAQKDGFDVRTVRKYLSTLEKREELAQARTTVYREAMRQHFDDFIDVAKRLESRIVDGEVTSDLAASSPVYEALKDHLPQSTVWKRLDSWNELIKNESRCQIALDEAIKDYVKNDLALARLYSGTQADLFFVEYFLAFQINYFLRNGVFAYDADKGIIYTPSPTPGLLDAKFTDAYKLGSIQPGKQSDLSAALKSAQTNLINSPEFRTLQEIRSEKTKARAPIKEQLDVVIWKRVVPGHCKYCPI